MAQLDRIEATLTAIYEGLFKKSSPFVATSDGSPPQPVPVPGYEKVFGSKPAPGTPAYAEWRKMIPTVKEVLPGIPARFYSDVMQFVARTGVIPVFFESKAEGLRAVIVPGVTPWHVSPDRFVGANKEGLIAAVTGGIKPGEPVGPF